MSESLKDKVYNLSNKLISGKNYINKNNMIYLKPNFKYITSNEKINSKKFDYAYYTDLENVKKVRDITSKNFISSKYPYLLIIKNKSNSDNVLLLIKTPKRKNLLGGMNSQFTTTEAGSGFDPEIITKDGIDLGQYRAPKVPIGDLPYNLRKHDHNEYPADQMFDNKEMETLIEGEKIKYQNYEDGFTKGFDNGYHKGYYFGYSAASAYLYRFYKKYYSDYMNKYEIKLKQYSNQKLAEEEAKINKEKKEFLDEVLVKNNLDPNTFEPNSKEKDEEIFGSKKSGSNFWGDDEGYDEEYDEGNNDEGDDFWGSGDDGNMFGGNLKGGFFFKNYKYYDYESLDTKDEYDGLPTYMHPANVLSLETLQPKKSGIFYLLDMFLDPPPITEDPSRHCKKPSRKDLDFTIRQLFHPRYRDAIISSEDAWDQNFFDKGCTRRALRVMKYCPHRKHVGVEFDPKVGKFKKICKKDDDEVITGSIIFYVLLLVSLGVLSYYALPYLLPQEIPPETVPTNEDPIPELDDALDMPFEGVPGL